MTTSFDYRVYHSQVRCVLWNEKFCRSLHSYGTCVSIILVLVAEYFPLVIVARLRFYRCFLYGVTTYFMKPQILIVDSIYTPLLFACQYLIFIYLWLYNLHAICLLVTIFKRFSFNFQSLQNSNENCIVVYFAFNSFFFVILSVLLSPSTLII